MKRLDQYAAYELPITDIFFDSAFNCRGAFTPQSVFDLSESIAENGLQLPVVVQPYGKDGFKYRLLAGHRRFKAVTIFLKWEEIPATLRADLSEHQARILNLTENLERKDLNMLEEANALHNLYPDGVPLRKAANEIKRPTRWIATRFRLLKLPVEIQTWAAVGLISALNIDVLFDLDSDAARLRAAEMIVQHKADHGPKSRLPPEGRRKFRPRRTKAQIGEMIAHLFTVNCDGLATRILAWATGKIEDQEVERDIKNATEYQPPEGYTGPFGDD